MRAFKTGILITLATIAVGAATLTPTTGQELSSAKNCLHKEQIVNQPQSQCLKVEEDSSWISWLTGDSRSAQFHYLDLLELLTGTDDKHKPSSIKPLF